MLSARWGSRNHESTSHIVVTMTPYVNASATTSSGKSSARRIGAAEEPTAMKAANQPRKRSVERAGLGVFVTGSCHASAVTARSERRSADDW